MYIKPMLCISISLTLCLFTCSLSYAQMRTTNADGSYNPYAYKEWSQSQTNKQFRETSSKALQKTNNNNPATKTAVTDKSSLKQTPVDKAKNNSCISGNCKDGVGTLQGTPDVQYKYAGGFKNGEFHGKGKEIDFEGYVTFDGEYANGLKLYGRKVSYKQQRVFGDETVRYYNEYASNVYVGTFKEYWADGLGVLDEYDKYGNLVSTYEGNFKKGVKDGSGTLVQYSHETILGFYTGEWKKNQRNGKGVDSTAWSGAYVGQFINDARDGEGVSYWKNTTANDLVPQYVGSWKEGMKHGAGADYNTKGELVYEGNFFQDKRHGNGKIYKADGTAQSGTWVNGINNDLDPTAALNEKKVLKEINENFDNGNLNKWSDYSFQKLEKGSYTVSGAGKLTENTSVLVPGSISFTQNDDWSYEATMKKMGGRDALAYGIGWFRDGEFMISNDDLVSFHFGKGWPRPGITDKKCKVKSGFNTLTIVKKGSSISAMVNGNTVYTGEANNLESAGLYLLLTGSTSKDFKVKYTSVIFKRL